MSIGAKRVGTSETALPGERSGPIGKLLGATFTLVGGLTGVAMSLHGAPPWDAVAAGAGVLIAELELATFLATFAQRGSKPV